MARRTLEDPEPLTLDNWLAQEPCEECGGRPGYNIATGVHLRIKSVSGGEWVEGHTYNCSKRPQ